MVDSVGSTQALLRRVLAWDYFELYNKQSEQDGVFEDAKAVPPTFSSMKVGQWDVRTVLAGVGVAGFVFN